MHMSHTQLNKLNFMLLLFISTSLLIGCSVGSGAEVKSKLDYLNGENWEKSQFTVANAQIPTGIKKIDTVIQGGIYQKGVIPLKFSTVYLLKGNKIIAETTSNHLGIFVLKGYIPNDRYIIKVDYKSYSWKEEITVDRYEIRDLEFNID
jgi:hypothetical protein